MTFKNRPNGLETNRPKEYVEQLLLKRHYTKAEALSEFASKVYTQNKRGITFNDLVHSSFAKHKLQAQRILKNAVRNKTLFTLKKHRPQIYYPESMRSKIYKDQLSRNRLKELTGILPSKNGFESVDESIIIPSLVEYVLPLLPGSPLFVHKIHMKTKLPPKCYADLPIHANSSNKSKKYEEIIGNTRVIYLFYPAGTVMISTESTNTPFKLENEEDRSLILTYFGQIRDRLIMIVADPHERFVPEVLRWEVTQFEINKDIHVSDWLQYTGIKIQIKHLDSLFKIYIKSLGKDTVCRTEKSLNPKNQSAIEVISDILDPFGRFARDISEIKDQLSILTSRRKPEFPPGEKEEI